MQDALLGWQMDNGIHGIVSEGQVSKMSMAVIARGLVAQAQRSVNKKRDTYNVDE